MISALILTLGTVIVAVITGYTAVYVKKLDKNNSSQHDVNLGMLQEIKSDILDLREAVADVRDSQLGHFQWHTLKEGAEVVVLAERRDKPA